MKLQELSEPNTSENSVADFEKCGHFPFNPSKVMDWILYIDAESSSSPKAVAQDVDNTLIELLNKIRKVLEPPVKRAARKKDFLGVLQQVLFQICRIQKEGWCYWQWRRWSQMGVNKSSLIVMKRRMWAIKITIFRVLNQKAVLTLNHLTWTFSDFIIATFHSNKRGI